MNLKRRSKGQTSLNWMIWLISSLDTDVSIDLFVWPHADPRGSIGRIYIQIDTEIRSNG